MMANNTCIREGQIVTGPLFDEPMRVETCRAEGSATWVVGLVGLRTQRFRKVTLTETDIESLTILDSAFSYRGDGALLKGARSSKLTHSASPTSSTLTSAFQFPALTLCLISLRQCTNTF